MNAVIYARYSSHGQTEQSIEGQLRVCKEYAERNGYNLIGEYIDRATSGTTDNRPSFLQMIDDASKKEFQYIIVYKLDRFARNRYDSVFYKHKLQQLGIKVLSAMEAISDTMEGRFLEGMLEIIGEMYSHDLSQKVKRGLKESVAKGNFTGGYNLLGYKVVGEKNNRRVAIDEKTAPIIKYAFEQYAAGMGKKQIVENLNQKGYRTNSGKKFTINSFYNNLSNKKYIGINYFNGELSENSYPPLIDKQLFDKVQARLKQNQHAPATAKAKQEYLLSGKAFCGHCGATLVGIAGTSKTKERHYYYACTNQFKNHTCNKKYEKKGYIEWYVVEQTVQFVLNPKHSKEIAEKVTEEYSKSVSAQKIKEYEKRLDNIEKEFDKQTKLFINTGSVELQKRINEYCQDLELQKADLLSELKKLKIASYLKHTEDDIIKCLKAFTIGNPLDLDYQKKIIHTFVNNIYLFDDKLVIYYNLLNHKQVSYFEMLENIEGEDFSIEDGQSGFLFDVTHPARRNCV